jgi:glycosyltransferase involved in cell wall biosynthesis
MSQPLVSVIVRSFNRVPSLCELLDSVLRQTWSNLEIIVVEQSTNIPTEAATRLAELARDPRVVLLHRHPLGGAAARNVGVERARGEVLLFIDDDDMPADEHWVALHMQALEDPRCLGVSGKHIQTDRPVQKFTRLKAWITGTLSYEPFLKLSMTYVEHDYRRIPVSAIHGTNASLRRSAWQRFGGWDEDTAIEDEVSFCFRAMRLKKPDEYFAYDPRPTILRSRDVEGGLGKRHMRIGTFFGHYMDHVHRIHGRYHPLRVVVMYPIYLIAAYIIAVVNVWRHSRFHRSALARLGASLGMLVFLPIHVGAALLRLIQPADAIGKVKAARLPPPALRAAPPPLRPDAVMDDQPSSGLASY